MSDDTFEAALEAAAQESTIEQEISAEEATELVIDAPDGEKSAEESEENDPLAEFRRALRSAPGDWYVIHSYAGYENRVKGNLENRIHTLNMEDFIYQIEVPQEEITEIKNGVRKQVRYRANHRLSKPLVELLFHLSCSKSLSVPPQYSTCCCHSRTESDNQN